MDPATHDVHTVAPLLLEVPAGQAEQSVSDVWVHADDAYMPAEHVWQGEQTVSAEAVHCEPAHCPAAQVLHGNAAVALQYEFAGHATGAAEPPAQVKPAGQAAHTVLEAAVQALVRYWPAGHTLHVLQAVAPTVVEYPPTKLQGMQAASPLLEHAEKMKVPAWHTVQLRQAERVLGCSV